MITTYQMLEPGVLRAFSPETLSFQIISMVIWWQFMIVTFGVYVISALWNLAGYELAMKYSGLPFGQMAGYYKENLRRISLLATFLVSTFLMFIHINGSILG